MACNPPVSVVMPVHNGSRFVAEAMQSVFAQTFTDFEFIVVDDGSTDDTAAIVASFRDDRLVALRHPSNLGLRAALNTGCRHARGPFIARMDADDVCAPGRFAAQVEALRSDERIGVIGSAVQLIDAEGRPLGTKAFPEDPALVAWSMFFFNSVAHPAVMMRRDIAAAAGFYPAGCAGGTEDYALFIRLSRGTRITNLPEPLLSYRVSTTNMTRQRWDEQENDADRIVGGALAEYLGIVLAAAEVRALRGLSVDRYPQSADGIRALSDIIVRLRSAFLDRSALDADGERAVTRDAAVRLWLLATLGARHSPALALSLIRSATLMDPGSVSKFAAKVGRRMLARS